MYFIKNVIFLIKKESFKPKFNLLHDEKADGISSPHQLHDQFHLVHLVYRQLPETPCLPSIGIACGFLATL